MVKKRDFPVKLIRIFDGKEFKFYSYHRSKRIAKRTQVFLDDPTRIVKIKEGYLVYIRRKSRNK